MKGEGGESEEKQSGNTAHGMEAPGGEQASGNYGNCRIVRAAGDEWVEQSTENGDSGDQDDGPVRPNQLGEHAFEFRRRHGDAAATIFGYTQERIGLRGTTPKREYALRSRGGHALW